MRILHLTLSFETGGRRVAIENLVAGLKTKGHDCYLACTTHLGCDENLLSSLFSAHIALQQKSTFSGRTVGLLRDFCAKNAIDIIHTHDAASLLLASRAGMFRKQRPAAVTTFHRSLGFETESLKGKLRNGLALTNCDQVITASSERREHYVNQNFVDEQKVCVIPLGIDTERFSHVPSDRSAVRSDLGIANEDFVFGAVGHFGLEKGIDVVIEAFLNLPSTIRDQSWLLIAGKGDSADEARIKNLLSGNRGAERVKLLGFRRDAHRLMSAFDTFVHGARIEAFGLVLVEAMSASLPVLAPRTGGIPDIVVDEVGAMYPPGNWEALTILMQRVVEDSSYREAAANAAQRRAQELYSIGRYAEDHIQLYKTVSS